MTKKCSTVFKNCIVGLLILSISSCTAYKKLPYLEHAEDIPTQEFKATATISEFKIMPKDILSITVNTSTPEAASDFNMQSIPSTLSGSQTGSESLQKYIVDNNGNIEFPVLGTINVAGLTRSEAEKKIYNLIYPQYIKEKPFVNIRCLNFKVTVMGEVARPGIYSTENDKMTLLDALASAGDLTIHGKRQNVMLIRENETGELSIHRINLQDRNILLQKDIYYLQQNDKIIVEANKTKGNSSAIGTLETLALSATSLLIALIAILTR